MTEKNYVRTNGFEYKRPVKTIPTDQIDKLSYGLHPDGCVNPYETPPMSTEYRLKFCSAFKSERSPATKSEDVSRAERDRVIGLMGSLSTVHRRSYTDPRSSRYPLIRSRAAVPPLDRSREAELKNFKMNGLSEYQAVYDRDERRGIVLDTRDESTVSMIVR